MPKLMREAALVGRKLRVQPSDLGSHLARTRRLGAAQRHHARKNVDVAAPYVAHFGVHLTGDNAGDVLLYESVERLFCGNWPSLRWRRLPLRQEVADNTVDELNAEAAAVVVGGGGLIFPRASSQSRSGWQWNIDRDRLTRLSSPLVLFGVGVNNFRNQTGFAADAIDHLSMTADKAIFIGLRNRGSIQRFLDLVPDADPARIVFQPCPTTVLGEFLPIALKLRDTPRVAVNVAMDRANLRFKDPDQTLSAIAMACSKVSAAGANVVAVTHADGDDAIVPHLHQAGVRHEVVRLERRLPDEIIDFYSSVDLTLGMRGHAQMIPFGCGGMILSLISHDKLAYFLDDIGHPEWGIEADQDDLEGLIADKSLELLAKKEEVLDEIGRARRELWENTSRNLSTISLAAPGPLS